MWSPQTRTLAITIAPFWWETTWFAVGLALVTALIVAGGLRFRIHRLRVNQQHLTNLVAERTSELSERTDALMRSNVQLIEQMSERERAEAELRQSHAGLATLLSASQELALESDVDHLPDRILEQLARIVGYDCAIFSELEGDMLVIRAARGFTTDVQGQSFDVASVPPASELIARRAPMVMADLQSESSALVFVEAVFGEQIRQHAWMGVPLIANDEVVGILSALHDEVGYYKQADQQRAQIFANLAAAALENARLSEMDRASAVLEERGRIARDLHDAVSQTLFSASLIAEGLRDSRQLSADRERQGLEDLRRLTRGALAEMRALLYELHPGGLAEKPLGHLLDSLCLAFTSRTHIPVALSVTGSDRLQPAVQEMLYRIAQEALNNISKHAAANAARVALTCSPEQVELSIADDGRGFDVASQSHASLGLGIMRERAAKIGAVLRIESHVGSGTTITVVWRAASPHRSAASPPAR
ncbi:MAG TPA: histidine kinase [Roseiflexaceae bacterium]|nr:histidine kinase [Roseiflexaceae bacterium]